MGIDNTTFEAILLGLQCTPGRNILTLGRQGFTPSYDAYMSLMKKYGLTCEGNPFSMKFCEGFFSGIGSTGIESIDYSNYESATYNHDMNMEISSNFHNKYDIIIDGGTIEHIFNVPQVFENIINMLTINGIFISVTCNNNFSGHGFYQYSPEVFLSAFTEKYGMKLEKLYLAVCDTDLSQWVDVNSHNTGGTKRVETMIQTSKQTYIITIARKVSNERCSLITQPPQQYSYAEGDWK